MKHITSFPENRWFRICLVVLILSALFTNLDTSGLQGEEPRRAIVAQEMIISGEYLVPKINGRLYYNKTPAFNWILVFFIKLFGSYENWVLRLPTIISFLAIALINYRVVKAKTDRQAALFSSLIFLTVPNLLFYISFQAEIDLYYTLVVYLQILCLLHYFDREQYAPMFLISYGLTGYGFLVKGIPSLAFQAITILVLFLYHKRYKALFSPWNFAGIALMLLIICSYFIIYGQQEDPWPMLSQIITESSKRSALESSFLSSVMHLLTFPVLLATVMVYWLGLLPLHRLRPAWQTVAGNRWLHLTVLFIVPNILIYWLSPGTKDRYLYMFLPFASTILFVLFRQYPHRFFTWLIFTGIAGAALTGVAFPFVSPLPLVHTLVVSAFIVSFCIAALWALLKWPAYRLIIFICTLFLARIAFNFTILPMRKLNQNDFQMLSRKLTEHNVSAFVGHERIQKPYNLLLQDSVTFTTIDHPPYELPYYYGKETGRILPAVTKREPGNAYVEMLYEYNHRQDHLILDTLETVKKKNFMIIYKTGN